MTRDVLRPGIHTEYCNRTHNCDEFYIVLTHLFNNKASDITTNGIFVIYNSITLMYLSRIRRTPTLNSSRQRFHGPLIFAPHYVLARNEEGNTIVVFYPTKRAPRSARVADSRDFSGRQGHHQTNRHLYRLDRSH